MLFLVRSAICIGTVAMLASGGGDRVGWSGPLEVAGGAAAQHLRQACLGSAACLEAGVGAVTAMARLGTAPQSPQGRTSRSTDTLSGADLAPAWTAPVRHAARAGARGTAVARL